MGDTKMATAYGDECWARVLIDWASYRESGLNAHENWWPALYREWCRAAGREPEGTVLAYATTYETQRADLRELIPSA